MLARYAMVFLAIQWMTSAVAATPKSITPEEAAQVRKGWGSDGLHKEHCLSSVEYIKTLEFLRKENSIPEKEARKIASLVSVGCNGAAERFSKAFLTMRKSGVSLQKSVDIGLALVSEDPLTVKNFYEIFGKMYLGEYFDIDFKASFKIAFELSKNFMGDLDTARKDFNEFAKFCLDQSKVGLSASQCASITVQFARLSQYYPKGIFNDFKSIYESLRDDKKFGVSMQEALKVSEEVLKNGPAAKNNFMLAFQYASEKEGLNMPGRDALNFAMQMAQRSYSGEAPPIYPGDQILNPKVR